MSTNIKLFWSFLKIGGFTIGGGMAMIPLMEAEIIRKHQWLTKDEFLDIMAASQAIPGIFAINMASHIGYKVGGLSGAIISSIGNIIPSFVIILLIAIGFRHIDDNPYIEAVFKGIRPAVVALIALPVFNMAKAARLTRYNIWLPVVSTLLIWLLGVSPVIIVAAAGIGGYIYGRYLKQRSAAKKKQ